MKIVEMYGGEQVGVAEIPAPEPSGDLVLVKVLSSTICGTELRSWQVDGAAEGGMMNSGHEGAGVVVQAGPQARLTEGTRVTVLPDLGVKCGNCVHCHRGEWLLCLNPGEYGLDWRGTHSQYILRPDSYCIPIPDDLSCELASLLVDAVGTPYRAIRRLGVDGFDTVLITGLGPLGAAASIICHALGARVIATEPSEYRRARSGEYGVALAIDPNAEDALTRVMALTGGRGVDIALDFTGYTEPQLLCLDAARRRGAVGFIGLKYDETPDGPVPRPTPVTVAGHLLPKELTLIGSWSVSPQELLELIELVQNGLPIERLITHRFSINDAQQAYETAFNQLGCKVIIDPWLD